MYNSFHNSIRNISILIPDQTNVDLAYNRHEGFSRKCFALLQIIPQSCLLVSGAKNSRARRGGRGVGEAKQVTFYWATRRMSYTHRNSNKFK